MPEIHLTALALSILSLLSERPMHPYEIRQVALQRKHDRIVNMPGGSLYSTIHRLESEELIVATGASREGRRPERTTYDITPDGEEALLNWLRDAIVHPATEFPQFASVIAFFPHLMPTDVTQLLRERLANLERAIAIAQTTLQEPFWSNLPRMFRLHEEYKLQLQAAERTWVSNLIHDIESGSLTWPRVIVEWHEKRGTWLEAPSIASETNESR